MQKHRSNRVRRISITVAQVVGATAAATITAGAAAAESLSRPEVSPDRSSSPGISRDGTYGGTGAHSVDPYGYHHRDANPLHQNQHQQNLRELRANPQLPQQHDIPADSPTGPTTWTTTDGADGASWAVCRPQASWC